MDSEGSDTLDPVGDLFHEVDEDRSGELDIDEVRKLCKRLGQKLDNAAVSRAFREMDADASGGVDLQVRHLRSTVVKATRARDMSVSPSLVCARAPPSLACGLGLAPASRIPVGFILAR